VLPLIGEHRDNLVRSLLVSGKAFGIQNGGVLWAQDGKVWLVGDVQASLQGDYFEFLEHVREGKVPSFREMKR
jgi:hypothetical protein